jgi:hypothetical protein
MSRRYNITSQERTDCVNRSPSARGDNSPGLCDSRHGIDRIVISVRHVADELLKQNQTD